MNALNFIWDNVDESTRESTPTRYKTKTEISPKQTEELRKQKINLARDSSRLITSSKTPTKKFIKRNELTFKPEINKNSAQIFSKLNSNTALNVEDRLLSYQRSKLVNKSVEEIKVVGSKMTPDKIKKFYDKRDIIRK